MSQRITNRSSLKNGDWLSNAALTNWQEIPPAPHEGLRTQDFDLAQNINANLAVQHIKDAFERQVSLVGENPSTGERVATDGAMAVAVHKAFDGLTIREASDADFWASITCFGCPKYVRWRWTTNKSGALWTRYAGNIRRNAISRLWWWAEITCDHSKTLDDSHRYDITRNVQDRQSLMLWYIDCAFSGLPLLAHRLAAFQQQHDLDDRRQKDICRTVNRLARVVCLDSIVSAAASDALCKRAHEISQLLAAA